MKHTKNIGSGHRTPSMRVVALGGLGEVGRNMYVLEYEKSILVLDAGLRFPEEDMPGIDYIIPNIDYLKKHRKHIKGIFISHSHYDHIGAIPYIARDLNYPTIYATPLTRALILKRQQEFPDRGRVKVETIRPGQKIALQPFVVEPFHQNHNVPDSAGFSVQTPLGRILYTGDFKFDFRPVGDKPADLTQIGHFGQREVLLLMSDSTDAEEIGHSISEGKIQENIDIIFRKAEGRIIVATFSSLLTRIQEIINLSEKHGRRVVIEGYSMKTNVEIAKRLGYIKIKPGTQVNVKEAIKMRPEHVTVICTGAQGEEGAVLMKIATRQHRYLRIEKGDTIVFSSSVIPGNEQTVQGLKDDLYREGAQVFHSKIMDIHSGGHAPREDLRLMMALTKPKYFLPIHGNYSMLVSHAQLAKEMGINEKNIVIADNGEIIEVSRSYIKKTGKEVATNYVMVDGLGVGDVGNVVLRDRQTMSRDGMFVVIAVIDAQKKTLQKGSDIISRGFVYVKESKELISKVRELIKETVEAHLKTLNQKDRINYSHLRNLLRDKIGEFLFQKTERRPMVLPVIIEV